jgi:hypothetical protein
MPDSPEFENDPMTEDDALSGNMNARAEDENRTPPREQRDRSGSVLAPYETADYVEKTDTASPSTVTSREMYVERMKANLEERGIAINALAERAEGLEPSARGPYLDQIANLRALQDRATQMLHSLSETGESAWRSMSEGVDVAYEGLHSALDSVMSRFRPER